MHIFCAPFYNHFVSIAEHVFRFACVGTWGAIVVCRGSLRRELMKEKFQSFGKAMLVPITLIAISGLFLGIGSVFTTELTLVSLGVNWDWYAASPLFTFFSVFKGLGEVIIGNLGV